MRFKKIIKEIITDESTKYVAGMLCWFFVLILIISAIVLSGAFIMNIVLKVICISLVLIMLFLWMFAGCVMAIRMSRIKGE